MDSKRLQQRVAAALVLRRSTVHRSRCSYATMTITSL